MRNTLLLVVILGFLHACANIDRDQDDPEPSSFELGYGFYTQSFQRLEGYRQESGLTLIFPAIPGALFGNPTGDILHIADVGDGPTFDLVLPGNVSARAETLNSQELDVAPSDTKVLRLATFHIFPSYENHIGGGGFVNAESGNFLILVYFSNAVEIRGTTSMGGEVFDHEVSVSEPGWSWIEVAELSPNSYQVYQYDGSAEDVEFSVIVDNASSI